MVEKFKTILQQITDAKGEMTLFAMMKMDEFTDKWSVVVCAPWARTENRSENFTFIKGVLDANLNEEERITIARIGIFPKQDQAIQALLQFQEGTTIKEDTKINGFMVHEAHILHSNSNL